jgi:hypothetical protein
MNVGQAWQNPLGGVFSDLIRAILEPLKQPHQLPHRHMYIVQMGKSKFCRFDMACDMTNVID